MTREEAILKVKRLYALANSTTAGEAQAAIRAADRIVQEFRIAEAEVQAARGEKPVFGYSDAELATGELPFWKASLIAILCEHYGCKSTRERRGRHTCWMPWGTETDRAMVELQYDRVVAQINASTLRACKGQGRTVANSFRVGMVVELAKILGSKDALPPSDSTALARVENRCAQAEEALIDDFAKRGQAVTLYQPNPPNAFDREAADRGRQAGRHLHVGDDLESKVKGVFG